jgi:NAD(P)-dependent dehydrogenase (short-subunit alcohol dehydrogenase family)
MAGQTANILFTVAFDERHRKNGIRAAAVHPGAIQTELARHMDPGQMQALIDQINKQLAGEGKPPFKFKTIPQGAATSVWAGVVAPADEIGGRIARIAMSVISCRTTCRSRSVSEGVRGYALDPSTATALWRKSEELVGECIQRSPC